MLKITSRKIKEHLHKDGLYQVYGLEKTKINI